MRKLKDFKCTFWSEKYGISFSYIALVGRLGSGGFAIRLKRLKPRARDLRGSKILGVRTVSSISVSNHICIFVLVQRTFFYYAANKRSL